MNQPFLREILIKSMGLPRAIGLVQFPFHIPENIIFEAGAIFQHFSLVPLVTAGQKIAVIVVLKRSKPFKNSRVLFHSVASNSRFMSDAVP